MHLHDDTLLAVMPCFDGRCDVAFKVASHLRLCFALVLMALVTLSCWSRRPCFVGRDDLVFVATTLSCWSPRPRFVRGDDLVLLVATTLFPWSMTFFLCFDPNTIGTTFILRFFVRQCLVFKAAMTFFT